MCINSQDAKNELDNLDKLQETANSSIVQHYASWAGADGIFYLLLPLAQEGNLAERMKRPRPDHDIPNILWFLRVLHALSDGMRSMHRHDPKAHHLDSGYATYHFDIKPENLLLFHDEHGEGSVLKIADFGSSYTGRLKRGGVSEKVESRGNTIGYQAPEFNKASSSSRPYDMWAVGCVVLEFLLWFADPTWVTSPDEDGRETFRVQRLQACRKCRMQTHIKGADTDGFWVRMREPEAVESCDLNPAVQERCDKFLEMENRLVFKNLMEVVLKLVKIDPDDRLKAQDLHEQIERIMERTKQQIQVKPTDDRTLLKALWDPTIRPLTGIHPRTELSSDYEGSASETENQATHQSSEADPASDILGTGATFSTSRSL